MLVLEDYIIQGGYLQNLTAWIRLNNLPYSSTAYIRAVLEDSEHSVYDSTLSFVNLRGIRSTSMNWTMQDNTILKVYPNPTSGLITISVDNNPLDGAFIEIYTLQGTRVYSKQKLKGNTIDLNLENFPIGVSLLKASIDGKVYLKKICKE